MKSRKHRVSDEALNRVLDLIGGSVRPTPEVARQYIDIYFARKREEEQGTHPERLARYARIAEAAKRAREEFSALEAAVQALDLPARGRLGWHTPPTAEPRAGRTAEPAADVGRWLDRLESYARRHRTAPDRKDAARILMQGCLHFWKREHGETLRRSRVNGKLSGPLPRFVEAFFDLVGAEPSEHLFNEELRESKQRTAKAQQRRRMDIAPAVLRLAGRTKTARRKG